MRTRLCAVFALFLAVFGTLVCSLTLTATNRAWAASARAQSVVSLRLGEGRGNLFDCNFTRLTGFLLYTSCGKGSPLGVLA